MDENTSPIQLLTEHQAVMELWKRIADKESAFCYLCKQPLEVLVDVKDIWLKPCSCLNLNGPTARNTILSLFELDNKIYARIFAIAEMKPEKSALVLPFKKRLV